MIATLLRVFTFFFEFWVKLPEKTKEKIIDAIVDSFESLLRGYYKRYVAEQQKAEEEKGNNV
uniref:hypothetical protein n=1 Tax=Psychrobacter sp. TaxID=56811 RepID=UPI0015EEF2C4|nr:hypothetical protein [Psychrobacter sp.]